MLIKFTSEEKAVTLLCTDVPGSILGAESVYNEVCRGFFQYRQEYSGTTP
jgi:hypothetical protein